MTLAPQRANDRVVVDSNAYRTFLSVDDVPNVIDRVTDQLGSWLREKGWDVSLDTDGFHHGVDAELVILHRRSGEGSAFRARLVETTTVGEWRTELTAFEPLSGPAWVALEVVNSEGRFVNVPRIAAYLMDSLPTRDGSSLLSSTARIIGSDGVDAVMESIQDPRRQGLYLVAGTGRADIDLELFRKQVDRWARQVRGLAQVVVLNADATVDMSDAFGDGHGVRPWTIRTFQPGADPNDPDDGVRHRFLSTERLAYDPVPEIVKLLGRVARRHAARRNPPDGFTRVDRAFARIENSLLFDAVTAPGVAAPAAPMVNALAQPVEATPAEVEVAVVQPAVPADTEVARALDLVKIILGIEQITEERLQKIADEAEMGRLSATALDRIRAQLEEREQQIDALDDEVRSIRIERDDALEDAAIAEIAEAERADEVRWLRKRLAALEDWEGDPWGEPPIGAQTSYPDNFGELTTRLDEIGSSGVIFTGDRKRIGELDEYDTLGRAVRSAWDSLLVLVDYVRARGQGKCDAGVRHYLDNVPQGFRGIGPKRFAEGETAATMAAHGATRVFPVPEKVEPAGRVKMEAHFKLGKIGRISPRLHFIDCWPVDGHVYVGYLGRHLPLASD